MMINNSADIEELINKLETPLGRANAVVALSSKYQVPEENVREAIATFEAVYDAEAAQKQNYQDKPTKIILSAANLAIKIFWIEKAVDLKVKAGKTSDAAELAEEFGLDKKAFELYKEGERTVYKAIRLAEKLEVWDEYIQLCEQDGRPEDAIKKCKELGRPREAELIFTKVFVYKSKNNITPYLQQIADIAKQTGFEEYALNLCKEHENDKAMAVIAKELGKPMLAAIYFERIKKYAEAARQALLATKTDPTGRYVDEAIELFLKEVERLQKTYRYKESLEILKEIPITADSGDAVLDKIFDCYVRLKQFDEGAKYFEDKDVNKALLLLEKADKIGAAQILAAKHGLTDKIKEYAEKLRNSMSLAKIAAEEGNFDQAIAHYTALIEEEKATGTHYWYAADRALEAAGLCKKHGKEELAAEFEKQAREFFVLEMKTDEEQGFWERAAEFAGKAGDKEKAQLYLQIDAIARAFH